MSAITQPVNDYLAHTFKLSPAAILLVRANLGLTQAQMLTLAQSNVASYGARHEALVKEVASNETLAEQQEIVTSRDSKNAWFEIVQFCTRESATMYAFLANTEDVIYSSINPNSHGVV